MRAITFVISVQVVHANHAIEHGTCHDLCLVEVWIIMASTTTSSTTTTPITSTATAAAGCKKCNEFHYMTEF